MGYKVFQNGFPLPASDLNNYLMNQSVISFASSTERDTVLSSPLEGQLTWLADSNKYTYYTGSAWSDLIQASSTPVTEQSTSYTIVSGDANSYIYVTAAATITIADVLAVGESVNFISTTADAVDFATSGVTLNSKGGLVALTGQYSAATVTKKASGVYFLVGDLA